MQHVWQSPRGKPAVSHWASLLRLIWPIIVQSLAELSSFLLSPRQGAQLRFWRGNEPTVCNIRWHNPSQAFTTKHVSYPQLTATICFAFYLFYSHEITWHLRKWRYREDFQCHYSDCECQSIASHFGDKKQIEPFVAHLHKTQIACKRAYMIHFPFILSMQVSDTTWWVSCFRPLVQESTED